MDGRLCAHFGRLSHAWQSVLALIATRFLLSCAGLPAAIGSCWTGAFTAEYCCRGQRGRADCWDSIHNFDKCCHEYKNNTYPFNDLLWGRRTEPAVDPRKFPPKGKLAAAHLQCIMEMQKTGFWKGRLCEEFRGLVDRAVEAGTPGSETRAQYLGAHYRVLLRSLPYTSFVSPVFDAFYKARSFPREFWGRDDFALFEAAFRTLLAPGHVAVDGGANIGGYTQMMALAVASSGEVHSFEPFRITFQFLNANVVVAGLQNVWTYNKALSNRNGAKTKAYGTDIGDPAQQMIWNSLVIEREAHWEFGPQGMYLAEPSELEELEHVTLDSLNLRKVDFIKSDIEGMEGHLLLGGLQTLQTHWPSLLMEIKSNQRQPIHTFLVLELGYKCHSALTTNPSDFFCWHPNRVARMPGEGRRIQETIDLLTTERAFSYCSSCRKRKPAPIELPRSAEDASGKGSVTTVSSTVAPTSELDSSVSTVNAGVSSTVPPKARIAASEGPGASRDEELSINSVLIATEMSASATSGHVVDDTFDVTSETPSHSPVDLAAEPVTTSSVSNGCNDEDEFCGFWAAEGECTANPEFMLSSCRLSCGACTNFA
eukprot:TRINITY_DN54557_c0_g1_i1.p1 TRINITY_DN54557_c0_g1~~TRINITY_DN54557_c0_g1_i1.p1  ORF type:complete len:620 (-),score=103.38 TRINITY_DN54557_c0_g1_i1:302-2089(-)